MWFLKKKKIKELNPSPPSPSQAVAPQKKDALKTSLQQNIQTLKDTLGGSSDIIIREIRIGKEGTIKAGIIYTDGLTDTPSLQNFILETLMLDIKGIELQKKTSPEQNLISILKDVALTVGEIKEITNLDVLFTSLLSGDTIILIDGYAQGLIISNKHWVERGVTEPAAQTVVRGPREGFTENLRVNTALIRRKLKDPNLWMESKIIGTRTKTNIAIVYINGIANEYTKPLYTIDCVFPGVRYKLTEHSSSQIVQIIPHRVQLIEKAYSFRLDSHEYYFEKDYTSSVGRSF